MSYELKYKKYKNKYLELKNIQHGGGPATLYIQTKDFEFSLGVDSDIFSQIQELKDNYSLEIKFTSFNLYIKHDQDNMNINNYLERFNDYASSPPGKIQSRLKITKISPTTGQYSVEILFIIPESMSINVDLSGFNTFNSMISNDLSSTPFTFNINTMGSHTHVK